MRTEPNMPSNGDLRELALELVGKPAPGFDGNKTVLIKELGHKLKTIGEVERCNVTVRVNRDQLCIQVRITTSADYAPSEITQGVALILGGYIFDKRFFDGVAGLRPAR